MPEDEACAMQVCCFEIRRFDCAYGSAQRGYGVEVGSGVSVGIGVLVAVGVHVAVRVSVGLTVCEGVRVNEGVVVGIAVGASPSTVNCPIRFHSSPTKIWTS